MESMAVDDGEQAGRFGRGLAGRTPKTLYKVAGSGEPVFRSSTGRFALVPRFDWLRVVASCFGLFDFHRWRYCNA
jgi:hypothetical protein